VPGNASSMILIGLGVVAIVAAAIWRQTARRRRFASVNAQLDSADPEIRGAAGQRAVSLGLGGAARLLLPRVEHERDSAVRAAIALAVARRQWEPSGSKRVLALRMWASSELATQGFDVSPFGPAFTRISDMGGPARPAPPASVAPPTKEDAVNPSESTPIPAANDQARAS
jgi:hypothetical protein